MLACGCHVNFVIAGRLSVALGKRLLLRLGLPLEFRNGFGKPLLFRSGFGKPLGFVAALGSYT